MSYTEAIALFRRMGVNVETMTEADFRIRYFALVKPYFALS